MHIHREVSGAGPVVVLTHGFSATSQMYAATVPALAADHTVITLDLPGHGRSEVSADPADYSVATFVDAMIGSLDAAGGDGTERAVFVGHSLGGYLSLELALAHPDRVRGLVLYDTGPGYRNDEARAGWNRMCANYARDLETKGLAGLPGSEALVASSHSSATGLAIAARQVLTQQDGHVMDGLASITVPTLVIVGERDEPFVKGSHYMAGKIPGATVAVIPGAGHSPSVTHADAFNAVLRTFLERVDR